MVTLAWRGEAGFAIGAGPKEFAEGASYISRSLPRALVRLRVSGMDRLQDDLTPLFMQRKCKMMVVGDVMAILWSKDHRRSLGAADKITLQLEQFAKLSFVRFVPSRPRP